jgi:hypothetical protein
VAFFSVLGPFSFLWEVSLFILLHGAASLKTSPHSEEKSVGLWSNVFNIFYKGAKALNVCCVIGSIFSYCLCSKNARGLLLFDLRAYMNLGTSSS